MRSPADWINCRPQYATDLDFIRSIQADAMHISASLPGELNQHQINSVFEARVVRLEKYLQQEGHEITKYDGPDEKSATDV